MEIVPFVTDSLGDSSYLLVSGTDAAVIDPQRDIRPYLAAAGARGVTISRVFETHVHNDYISGGRELAARGATIVAPAKAKLNFPHQPIEDGQELCVGAVRLRALATPGHTYEHTSYLLLGEDGGVQGAFTGGCVIVASAGRSDLLGPDHTEELTRLQWESGRRIASLLTAESEVLPTHGAGSFCSSAGATSDRRSSLAQELATNPLFTSGAFEIFRRIHLGTPTPTPAYYQYMAPINRAGPKVTGTPPVPERLAPARLESLIAKGVPALDLRARSEYVAAHAPGSLAVEECTSLLGYVSWLFPFNAELALVTYDDVQAQRVTVDLYRIGYERVQGFLPFHVWLEQGHEADGFPAADLEAAADILRSGSQPVLDVRFDSEFAADPVPGARQLSFDRIQEWKDSVGKGPVLTICASGQRSTIAATYLASQGVRAMPLLRGGAPELRSLLPHQR
ncbi:MAG TPA: MBL fold metallo-hydrolase [Tepidiformaceae bacterium]|nr:MBL fold metallo-hydrolase [Tepidiformaceae bacterium]